MENWKPILSHFQMQGTPQTVEPFGNGWINDTYRVVTKEDNAPDYVLQRINHQIFTDVALMQDNIEKITRHIRKKLLEHGEKEIDRKCLQIVKTIDGENFYWLNDTYWRMTVLIADAQSFETVTPDLAYLTGKAFGEFQWMLSDLDEPLGATIPNFHNMEFRLEQFQEAFLNNKAQRLDKVAKIVDELLARADEMCQAERLFRLGKLPKRITHCDTKVNNMLFDKNNNFLCVIDLDTTMPGFVLSDFGDFIRTAGNTGAEDDRDLNNVGVNMEVFTTFAKGYLESTKPFITDVEIENLPFGAKMLTYMQTIRFLTDYLNGDTYYKIKYPEHNFDRTMAQLTLLKSLETHESEMKAVIENFCIKEN
ncbi:MAG: aminoglycoside phosphotransferase family protein [Bacteroidales bacterium]|nr:aminoglycoside phosphotransferase family protein [Bacteroidales bacterium]